MIRSDNDVRFESHVATEVELARLLEVRHDVGRMLRRRVARAKVSEARGDELQGKRAASVAAATAAASRGRNVASYSPDLFRR